MYAYILLKHEQNSFLLEMLRINDKMYEYTTKSDYHIKQQT